MPVALLIEDDPDVREIARDILNDAGFDVVEAADGDKGLACLESGIALDVMVTDCEMPGSLNGFGLLEAARQLRPGLPRIMVTGSLPEGFPCDAPILHKPYRDAAIFDALLSAMGGRIPEKTSFASH